MNRAVITLLCLLFLFACFFGCETSEREYKDDIVYELENGSDVINIKEWSFLLGSGAEIYYKAGGTKGRSFSVRHQAATTDFVLLKREHMR